MSASNEYLDGIAIIGMSGRFPGAPDIDSLWSQLKQGVELVSFFSREQLRESGVPARQVDNPRYVRARPVLEDIERFDASFFGFSPGEARLIGPERRLLLEGAWEALERAGYRPGEIEVPVGVFVGSSASSYWLDHIRPHPTFRGMLDDFEMETLNDKDSLATSLSYKLDLTGPSMTVQTFCSTSLVAVHMACQSLLAGECDLALAGGVACRLPQVSGHLYQEGSIRSPDGHTRTFDANAQGTVFGNGMGIVLLERTDDARRHRAHIHALVRGSAVNNDGARKVSFSGPSLIGQSQAVAEAIAIAEIDAGTIGYVEAHGTGTPVGDPVEVKALTRAFRESTDARGYCAIGSVKTNLGHLESASGVTGLIKAALCVEHGQVPPSLNYERPNPELDLDNSPFFVNTELRDWPLTHGKRRAGVSSLGIGGTNAHVVLQEPPPPLRVGHSRPQQLLLWSARSESAIERATTRLAGYLAEWTAREEDACRPRIADIAFTMHTGRRVFEHRRAIVCPDSTDVVTDLSGVLQALRAPDDSRVIRGEPTAGTRKVAFMFPGGGAQYPSMARELYDGEPVFRRVIDECAAAFAEHIPTDLRTILYPDHEQATGPEHDRRGDNPGGKNAQPTQALPALFATEVALARLLISLGIEPHALIGHSLGEYAAAYLAGVFTLAGACELVALRGQLFETLPAGSMLSTPLPAVALRPLLGDQLSLAADNGASFTVASGPSDAIAALQHKLSQQGVDARRLHIDVAAHSAMLQPILDRFRATVASQPLSAPAIPVVSNVTGDWLTADQAQDPDYWVRQLRHTVRFREGLSTLLEESNRVLIEVGPGRTLATFARTHPARTRQQWVGTTVRHPKDERSDLTVFLNTLGSLWVHGVELDAGKFWSDQDRCKVPLPTYPWDRQRHWIDAPSPDDALNAANRALVRENRSGQKRPMDDWFYTPHWHKNPLSATTPSVPIARRWLVFADDSQIIGTLVPQLTRAGASVAIVRPGDTFAHIARAPTPGVTVDQYQLDPARPEHYRHLMEALSADGIPDRVIHLWTIHRLSSSLPADEESRENPLDAQIKRFARAQERGFYSLLYLAQAFHHSAGKARVHIDVVSARIHAIDGAPGRPELATLLACCRVLPQELLSISARLIDTDIAVELPDIGEIGADDADGADDDNDDDDDDDDKDAPAREGDIARLMAELARPPAPEVIAWRRGQRFVLEYQTIACPAPAPDELPLRRGGVYLITGGLGDLGLAFAQHLARTVNAQLVLTSRSGLPARDSWDDVLARAEPRAPIRRRIEQIRAMEAAGGTVTVLAADATDAARMREVIAWCHEHHGGLHGVIHSAGTVDESAFKAVLETDRAICESHFQPKLHGLYALDRVLAEREPDFVLLMSSVASVLGGLGHLPYAAANLVLDEFAQTRRNGSTRWLSVGWDIFRFGKARDLERIVGATVTAVGKTLEALGLTLEEGNATLERVLAARQPHIVVSTGDLHARIDQWIRLESVKKERTTDIGDDSGSIDKAASSQLSPVEVALQQIWRDILGVADIGPHDDFFELGGHSLLALRLFSAIGEQFGQSLPLATLFQASTIAKLAALIGEQDETREDSALLVPIRPGGAKAPLFWTHGLGGDLLRYHPLLTQLDRERPVFGIQAPDQPFDSVENMAVRYADELIEYYPDERYALGGHSFGGTLAFELARQLQLRGREVRFLGIVDTDNESLYFSLEPKFLRHVAGHVGNWTKAFLRRPRAAQIASFRRLGGSLSQMARLRRPEKSVGGVINLTGYPEDRVIYAHTHYEAWKRHQPSPYPGVITLFRAREQRLLSVDPTLGWGRYAEVDIRPVPGNHGTIMRGSDVPALARALDEALAAVDRD